VSRRLRLAALALPLAGLAGLWFQSDAHYLSGTEWEVPIRGYDPRDVLRGHYVEFSYDWPGLAERGILPATLCLEGTPPVIARVTVHGGPARCPHPLRAAAGAVYGAEALQRGRLYVGQARAIALQQQLQNPELRGIVTIRQREDGSFTPISIRLRPLTATEKAAREERNAGAEEPRPPPPIMAE
jgi:hypothetical protein